MVTRDAHIVDAAWYWLKMDLPGLSTPPEKALAFCV